MKKPLILVSIVIVILSAMVVSLQVQLQNSQRAARTAQAELRKAKDTDYTKNLVYSVCQVTRTTNEMQDRTCGDLQYYYKMEYLCKQNNASVLNTCWVEYK